MCDAALGTVSTFETNHNTYWIFAYVIFLKRGCAADNYADLNR